MYDSIPVSQVRNASSWARLSPSGRRKVLVIENADRMQDSARNAFLKVLEEPPEDVVFVLTTARRGAIMPTILSRVRTYAFTERPAAAEAEVISRVFQDEAAEGESLGSYFYRFLPVPMATISSAADSFLLSLLQDAIDEGRRPLSGLRTALDADGSREAGRIRSIAELNASLNRCKPAVVWHLFLACLSRRSRLALRTGNADARETSVYSLWADSIRNAVDSVDVYNIASQSALEALYAEMKDRI